MTYEGIANISNEIRFVINTSREVNLAAQNASLAARQVSNVLGFKSVSIALKTFSQDLTVAMTNMTRDIFTIAHAVSSRSRQQHMFRHQETALNLGGEAKVLRHALHEIKLRQEVLFEELNSGFRQFSQSLVNAQRLCNSGRSLASAALIEASSGGKSESILRNVALDIERTIEEIFTRLKSIEIFLNERDLTA